MDHVHLAQHDDGVGEHDQVPAGHEECIKKDGISAHFSETFSSIWKNCCARCGAVQPNFDEFLLPSKGGLVCKLKLKTTTLKTKIFCQNINL